MEAEILPPESHSCVFRVQTDPKRAAFIVKSDGTVLVNNARCTPDRPLVVEIEGQQPNVEQLEACKALWQTLRQYFAFDVALFGHGLLQHMHQIRGPTC